MYLVAVLGGLIALFLFYQFSQKKQKRHLSELTTKLLSEKALVEPECESICRALSTAPIVDSEREVTNFPLNNTCNL